jgi:hypothetical protein
LRDPDQLGEKGAAATEELLVAGAQGVQAVLTVRGAPETVLRAAAVTHGPYLADATVAG